MTINKRGKRIWEDNLFPMFFQSLCNLDRLDLKLMALIASKRCVTNGFHILHVSQVSQNPDFLVCKVILLYLQILHLLLSLSPHSTQPCNFITHPCRRLKKKIAFLKSALTSPLQFCLSMPTFVYILI